MTRAESIVVRRPLFAALMVMIAAVSLLGGRARAEAAPRVLVLPSLSDVHGTASPELRSFAVERIVHALSEHGYQVTDPAAAHRQLTAYGRLPARFTPDDRLELKRLLREALLQTGRVQAGGGDRQQSELARAAVAGLMRFASSRLEVINRDEELAQKVLDACLLAPRRLIAENASESNVLLETFMCRQLVPGVVPSTIAHPPEVLAALVKADHLASTLPNGALEVRTSDDCRTCRVYLNGRPFGTTPLTTRLVPGTYRLQVEHPSQAAGTSMVHELLVADSRPHSAVVAGFEHHLRWNEGGPSFLEEEDAQTGDAAARELMRLLEVDRALLVRTAPEGSTFLRLVDAAPAIASCERAASGAPEQDVLQLVRCGDRERAQHRTLAAAPARSSARPDHPPEPGFRSSRPRATRNLGIGLLVAGGAAFAGTWIADRRTGSGRSDRLEHGLQASAAGSAGLLIASEPLWTPIGPKHPPWWQWSAMAAGAYPLIAGSWLWKQQGKCAVETTDGSCREVYTPRVRAALHLFAGLPLLSWPLAHYLARASWGRRAAVPISIGVSYHPDTPCLSLRGTF